MSATTVSPAMLPAGKASSATKGGGLGRWLVIGALVVASGALSALYAVNEYAGGTKLVVDNAAANAARFESLYRDGAEKRLATLRFGLDLLMQDKGITDRFAANDRDGLQAKVSGFFNEVLRPRYGLDQLNFFTPPAIVYLRADDPKVFGNDLSAVRRSVVTAGERRQTVSGLETGLGGVVALRAVSPVLDGERLVGTMGVGDSITQLLAKAGETAGIDWAVGLDQAVAEKAERSPDPRTDVVQGKDVFYAFSAPSVGAILRGVTIDPRSDAPVLATPGGRAVFIRSFALNNFSGVPTVVVAALLDVSAAFAEVRRSVAIKAVLLFLLLSVAGSVGVIRFRALRDGLNAALLGQGRELAEKTAALEKATLQLKDAEQLKRGFLTNLVTALGEPLQAVSGQLQAVGPSVEEALRGAHRPAVEERGAIVRQLRTALWETTRAARFVGDYQQLELFRQGLVKVDTPLVSLHAAVAQVLEVDAAATLRLNGLEVANGVPADLPRLRADPGLLRRALSSLINQAAEQAAAGGVEAGAGAEPALTIGAGVTDGAWLAITLTGPAFRAGGAPSEDTIERARGVLTQFSAMPGAPAECGASLGVVLALAIAEFFGGRLVAVAPGEGRHPGFVLQLPAAR